MNSVSEKVLQVLADVAGEKQVARNLDLRLYDQHILDSFKTVELIVAFSDQFGIDISPAEFEREQWATPQRIVEDIQRRVAAA